MNIRLLNTGDVDEVQNWYSMPYIKKIAFHEMGFQDFENSEHGFHFVGEDDDGLIGHAYAHVKDGRVYFTHIVGRKGLREMRESQMLIAHLYDFLPKYFPACQIFEGYVSGANKRALRFAESIDHKPELVRRKIVFLSGEYIDLHVFSMTRTDMARISGKILDILSHRSN